MAIERIPTDTTLPYYDVVVDLDGVEFKLQFRFIDRDDAWYLTIFDINDVLLRAGIKIVLQWPILRLWQEATRPEGEVLTLNQGNITQPPTLNQLGADVVLTYLDAAEIATLA